MHLPTSLRTLVLGLGTSSLIAAAVLWRPAHVAAQQGCETNAEFYTAKVQPILQNNCYRCHAGLNHRGGLMIDTHAGMMKGGHDGAVVVPFHPEQSLLIKLIRHEGPADDPMPMPPKSKLSDEDIATVTRWIACGALMPPDPAAQ